MYAPFSVQNAGQPPANIKAHGSLGSGTELEERLRRRQRLFWTVEDEFSKSAYPHLTSGKSDSREKDKEEAALREAAGSPAQAHAAIYKKGFDLVVSKLKDVFDISKEPAKTIESYGGRGNNFGMGCLLARRLVEKGVTCVEVDLGGWDNHNNIFTAIKGNGTNNMGNGGRLDKGMGSLVKELTDRGMWKNTVVLWMGEFGRTPRINGQNGRDHWPQVFSMVLGGGGIEGGRVIGSSDAGGFEIKDRPVTVEDYASTVYSCLGIDTRKQTVNELGRPIRILNGGVPIRELF